MMREGDVAIGRAAARSIRRRRRRCRAALKALPAVAGAGFKRAVLESFRETMAANMNLTIFINVLFASVIAFGVVYNAARVSLSERSRELASLRVLGFTRAEISLILLGELALLTLAALPVGGLLRLRSGRARSCSPSTARSIAFRSYVSRQAVAWSCLGDHRRRRRLGADRQAAARSARSRRGAEDSGVVDRASRICVTRTCADLVGDAGRASASSWRWRCGRARSRSMSRTVERGPMQVTIDEEGETRVRERFVVSAPVTGRLQRIELEPGDPVVRGKTVVARLTPAQSPLIDPRTRAELSAAVEAARAAVGQAQAERERAAAALARAQSTAAPPARRWPKPGAISRRRARGGADGGQDRRGGAARRRVRGGARRVRAPARAGAAAGRPASAAAPSTSSRRSTASC